MSLVKQSWRRVAEITRSDTRSLETDRLPSMPTLAAGLLAAVIALIAGIAPFVGQFVVPNAWSALTCFWAAVVCAGLFVDRFRVALAAERRNELAKSIEYQGLLEAVGDLVMHHGATGQVLSVQREARRTLQIRARDLLGPGFFNRIHVADRSEFMQALDAAAHGDSMTATKLRLRSDAAPNAENGLDEPVFTWVEIRLRALRSKGNEAKAHDEAAIVSVTRDISQANELQQQLDAARRDAVQAISLKDRLLANVSHELRTPLNAILGFSEILRDPELSPADPAKQMEYARIIHSSAEHLLSVVNLVLDMSKIEAGKFEVAPEPFALGPLVKDCCDMLRLRAELGNVALIRAPSEVSEELIADKRACRQILLNLISNAVKFTPSGGTVSIGFHSVDSAIHICVSDTGIGIAEEHLPRLGDPFFQVRSNYDRSHEGAGLGLSLVRGLVGLHGGTVRLESLPGVGTRVIVKLPLDCRLTAKTSEGAPRMETVAHMSVAASSLALPCELRASPFGREDGKVV